MLKLRRIWTLIHSSQSAEYIVPLVGGCELIVVSFLPWLHDPLGQEYTAWNLPVNLGWPFYSSLFNYGVLCIACACYAFTIAYLNWRALKRDGITGGRISVGLFCLLPVGLFLLQYLFTDLGAIAQFVQHQNQMALTQKHFGYKLGKGFFPLVAFQDISNVGNRFQLLVDLLQVGVLIQVLGAWMIVDFKRLAHPSTVRKPPISRWLTCAALALLLMVVGKAIGGEICENLAGNAVAAGNYGEALHWLDAADFLNPSLEQVPFYHIERGQVLYFMHPDQQDDDTRAYIAATLINRQDYQDAYQQLFITWQAHRTTPWMTDQISDTLEYLAESSHPAIIRALPQTSQHIVMNDAGALPWLQLLIQVDPRNLYGQYILGRIDYDLGNYAASENQLMSVLSLNPDTDIKSSIFTYMALSESMQGNYKEERVLLLQAEQLDPNYRNTTAREELSGLH